MGAFRFYKTAIFFAILFFTLGTPHAYSMGQNHQILIPKNAKEFNDYYQYSQWEAARELQVYKGKDVIDRYPELKKAIQEALTRLDQAQKDIINEDIRNPRVKSVKTEFTLQQSADDNMWFRRPIQTAKYMEEYKYLHEIKPLTIRNNLTLNTGMLQRMVKRPEDIDKVIALITHEYGHSISANMIDHFEGDHLDELGADYYAKVIAKKARLDPGLFYTGLDEILDKPLESNDENLKKGGKAFFDSHPEDEFRKTIKRIDLTVDRYSGWEEPIPFKNKISIGEMRALSLSDKHMSFPYTWMGKERNLDEVLDQMDRMRNYWDTPENRILENQTKFASLSYELDLHLLDNPKLTSAQKEKIATLFSYQGARGPVYPEVAHRRFPDVADEVQPPGSPETFKNQRKRVLEKNNWLQSEEYEKLFHQKLGSMNRFSRPQTIDEWHDTSGNLSEVLPPGKVTPVLEELLGPELQFGTSDRYDAFHHAEEKILHPLSVEDRAMALNHLFKKNAIPPDDLNSVIRLFLASHDGLEPILLWKNDVISPESLKKIPKELKELAETIWKNKSTFALSELYLPPDRAVNWDLVFDVAKIPREQGIRELKASVSQILRSPEQMKKIAHSLKRLTDRPGIEILTKDALYLPPEASVAAVKNPIWFDSTMAAKFDDRVVKNLDQMDRHVLKRAFYLRSGAIDPEAYRAKFKKTLSERLNKIRDVNPETLNHAIELTDIELKGLPLSDSNFSGIENKAFKAMTGWTGSHFEAALPQTHDLIAEWIDESSFKRAKKVELLNSVFNRPVNPIAHLENKWTSKDKAPRTNEILNRYEITPEAFGREASLNTNERIKFYKNAGPMHFTELDKIEALAAKEPALAKQRLQKFIQDVWVPQKRVLVQTPEAMELKKRVLGLMDQVKMNPNEQFDAFSLITRDGPAPEIDAKLIQLSQATRETADLEKFLVGSRLGLGAQSVHPGEFKSPEELNRFMKRWFELKLNSRTEISVEEMKDLYKQVLTVMNDPSSVRDELLESLAWKTPMATKADLFSLEQSKSSRAMFAGSKESTARLGSSIATYVGTLPPEEVSELIKHIQFHPGEALSPELRGRLVRHISQDAAALNSLRAAAAGGLDLNEEMGLSEALHGKKLLTNEELSNMAVDWTDKLLLNVRGNERVPIFDLLMHSGTKPIAGIPQYELKLMKEYLGYSAGSTEEKVMRAFLDSVPAYEKSVSLAYLIAQKSSRTASSSLAPLFEAFGTQGKKAAQMAKAWKLFGDRSDELAEFESSAKPMSKYRFRSILEKELTPAQLKTLKVKSVVNAASIKTVATVELADGTEQIIAVLEPDALNQSLSQFKFGKKFIKNLEKQGIKTEENLLNALMASMEAQIGREVDARYEAENLKLMKKAAAKLNRDYAAKMNQWKFEVPSLHPDYPATKSILVMERMKGVEFNKLPDLVRAAAGEEKVKGLVRLFFEHGLWDADRHVGNALYDAGTHTIGLIDLAQMEKFSKSLSFLPDERSNVAEFLYAMSSKDETYLARQASMMSKGAALSESEIRALAAKLKTVLEKGLTPQNQVIDTFKVLSESGVILKDKYSAGVLKGMITLSGVDYVPQERFAEIFGEEAGKYLKQKKSWMLRSMYQNTRLKNPGASKSDCFMQVISQVIAAPSAK